MRKLTMKNKCNVNILIIDTQYINNLVANNALRSGEWFPIIIS